jgi:protein-ribulosamine 3-kinase
MEILIEEIGNCLSAKFGKKIFVLLEKSLGGGCISQTSKLETSEGNFFLKWNNNCAPDIFLREADGLRELGKVKNPFLKIPEVISAKEANTTPGFIILGYFPPSSGGNNGDENLGKGLATIHETSSEKFGFYQDNYCGTTVQDNKWNSNLTDFFGQQRLWHLVTKINSERGVDSSQIKLFEKLVGRLPELIPATGKPALIHGDLWSGNYMFSSGRPVLIDPAACYADREMEFGIMTLFGGFTQRFWDSYNEVYPLPSGWKGRNKLYQLYHVLNHFYLFGGGYGQHAVDIARLYV